MIPMKRSLISSLTTIVLHKFLQIIVKFILYFMNLFDKSSKFTHEKKKNRFDFFDLNKTDDFRKLGILYNDKEWQFELPDQVKSEVIDIFGSNSWGQILRMTINWKNITNKNMSSIKVSLIFVDGKGNTYLMNERDLVESHPSKREYKAPGISLEVLAPFRRFRIKIRGYLQKKDSNELVFVKMRVFWLSFSNIFDFKSDHKKEFIENELNMNSKKIEFEEIKFENRFEQLGQMKGTFQFEGQNEETLFLWANKSKKYVETEQNRKIYRLFGYSKKGLGFNIGLIEDHNKGVTYRYGYGFSGKTLLSPIDSISDIDLSSLKTNSSFSLTVYGKTFHISIKDSVNENVYRIEINGYEGRALYYVDDEDQDQLLTDDDFNTHSYLPFITNVNDLVLPLNDRRAENVTISGGKGSSLASLNYFHEKTKIGLNFNIPKGIVVTSNAYQLMVKQSKQIQTSIENMEKVVSQTDLLKKESENVVNTFKGSQLSQEIKQQIDSNLKQLFGENGINQKSFAVRSSASGEDSEEMSAAGQMTTYLGVKGMDEIYSAVLKCWSSQFEFVAIEYKRSYGQPLNSLMAVVIQEMVDCDSAGVLFTCDPVSGNEREIIITGNYGIGESVVSAMAEPDTIKVEVNISGNTFDNRTAKQINSISIGSKSKSIKMSETGGGTVEVETNDTSKCCLSPENTLRLANVGLEIQKYFKSVRDIEWGLKDDIIYILQSRPITNLDSGYTEFELMHELDSGFPSEKEYLTKANVGEVIPGSMSIFMSEFQLRLWLPVIFRDMNRTLGIPMEMFSPYNKGSEFGTCYQHMFLNIKNSEFMKLSNDSNSTKAMILGIFGHELDPEIIEDCRETREADPWNIVLKKKLDLLQYLIVPHYCLNKFNKNTHKVKNIMNCSVKTSKNMFNDLLRNIFSFINEVSESHIKISEASMEWNHYLISILSQDKENFAYLLSECGQLVSVDVPSALRQLSQSIEDPKRFKEMSDDEALQYLQNGNHKSNKEFEDFLSKHGHRGYKEFEPMALSWKEDPIPLIKSLKTMLVGDTSSYKEKPKKDISEMVNSLKTPLSFIRRQLLKHIFLPFAQRGVAMREISKSLCVYSFNLIAKDLWRIAHTMHSEGLIPEADLLFQMDGNQILELFETRNPLIVWKARQRKRLYFKTNNWKFDEIISGYDFKPRELMEENISIMDNQVIRGTPVSVGKIVAKVCVAPNLEDAVHIQPGDILITYSTDIGWSPYFPMIGGIVTEIGGLISHGAVIAREYGLPCLVGVNNACLLFKTGDMVLLDCQNGLITRVDNNNNEELKQ